MTGPDSKAHAFQRLFARVAWGEAAGLSAFFGGVLLLSVAGDRAAIDILTHPANSSLFNNWAGTAVIRSVMLKTLLLHALFFLVHLLAINLLRPPRWLYSGFFLAYSYTFILVYYPHLLADFGHHELLVFFCRFPSAIYVKISGTIMLATLGCVGWRNGVSRTATVSVIGAFAAWIFMINDPARTFEPRRKHPPRQIERPSPRSDIILIGIDGLRPESLDRFRADGNRPHLARFLRESQSFTRAFTPLARTFPAINALLSGKTPIENGIRRNLQRNNYDSDRNLADSAIDQLKGMGYETTVGLSDSTYAFFRSGKVIDKYIGPPPGLHNFILPYFERDHLLFGWMNNSVGLKLIPEVIANGSLFDTWWPQIYRNQVIGDLSAMDGRAAPQFKLFHISKPHWPGSNQYPYYHVRRSSPYPGSPFGYLSLKKWPSSISSSSAIDVEENIAVYEQGVEQLVDSYLEEVLKYLYASGIMEKAVVALYSDHGESFFDSSLLPISKEPKHGSSLLFGEDSDRCFFAVRTSSNQLNPSLLDAPLSLSDAVKLMGRAAQLEFRLPHHRDVIVESDRWVSATFPGQLVALQRALDDIAVDDSGMPYFTTDPNDMMGKQRGIYDRTFRLTLFYTVYGYQLYLDRIGKNSGNLLSQNRDAAERLFHGLKASFQKDIRERRLPELSVDWTREDPSMLDWGLTPLQLVRRFNEEPKAWAWILYLRSKSLYFHDFDARNTLLLLGALLASADISHEIRARSEADVFRITAYTGLALPPELAARLHREPRPEWPKSLKRGWDLYRLLAAQRADTSDQAVRLLESAVRRHGDELQNLNTYPESLVTALVRHASYYHLRTRMARMAKFGWPRSTLDELSVMDRLLTRYHRLEQSTDPSEIERLSEELKVELQAQSKYGLYGINDEWYLNSMMRGFPRNRARSNLTLLALEDAQVNFETLALVEMQAQRRADYAGSIARETGLGGADKRRLFQAVLWLELAERFRAPPARQAQALRTVRLMASRVTEPRLTESIKALLARFGGGSRREDSGPS